MKKWKVALSLGIIALLFFSFVIAENKFESCEYDGFKKECTSPILGKKTLEISGDKFYTSSDSYKVVDPTLIPYNQNGYDYKTKSGLYTLYLKQNSNWGDGFKYCVDKDLQEYCLTYQTQDMSYRNSVGSQDYISSIQNANSQIINGKMFYSGIFPDVDLSYETDSQKVKEYFILNKKPKIPAGYLGKATLDFGGYIKYGQLDLFADGEIKTKSFKTKDKIEFKLNGETLFYLPKPYAYDNSGREIDLSYEVKIQGQQIWFYVQTPYSFLETANYPVKIDPTLTISSNTELCGLQEYDSVNISNGAIVTICDYNGTAGTGILNFSVSGEFYMASGTKVNGDSKGSRGGYFSGVSDYVNGEGLGGGAAQGTGAGHGANGGNREGDFGGISYNPNTELNISMGSGGGPGDLTDAGNFGNSGGDGGGSLSIYANNINLHGNISLMGANGANVEYNGYAGGGGSGGGLFLWSSNINISNSNVFIQGGAGGSWQNSGGTKCGGSGGAGGRIKIIYGSSISNTSLSVTKSGGAGGFGLSCANGNPGGEGTIFYYQNDTFFNQFPTLDSNETIPNIFTFGQKNVYFNISTSDADNDSITGAIFNLTMPNGTLVFSENGTWLSGDSSIGQSEIWESSRFNVTNTTGDVGRWNWSVKIVSNGSSPNQTYSDYFILTDSNAPSVTIDSPETNTYYANTSIPLKYNRADNIEVDSCWYSFGGSNFTIPSCANGTITSYTAGNYNFTLYANDTSGNLAITQVSNITLVHDLTAPEVVINAPIDNYTSTAIPYNISIEETYTLATCLYWITRGASLEVENTTITCNSTINGTAYVSSQNTDYVFHFFTNDTSGNSNTSVSSFSTTEDAIIITPPTTGGGGGGSPDVEEEEAVPGICDPYPKIFQEAWEAFLDEPTVESLKELWDAFWGRAVCDSASSIVPRPYFYS